MRERKQRKTELLVRKGSGMKCQRCSSVRSDHLCSNCTDLQKRLNVNTPYLGQKYEQEQTDKKIIMEHTKLGYSKKSSNIRHQSYSERLYTGSNRDDINGKKNLDRSNIRRQRRNATKQKRSERQKLQLCAKSKLQRY